VTNPCHLTLRQTRPRVVAVVSFVGASVLLSPVVAFASPAAATVTGDEPAVIADDQLRPDVSAPTVESATVAADLLGVPVEDLSAKSTTSAEYVLPSGALRVDQYVGEQFVRSGEGSAPGEWAVVSPLLIADQGDLVPEAYSRELRLSGGSLAAGVILRAELGDTGVVVEFVSGGPIPGPRVEGARAVYEQLRPGVDFVVDVRATGFEQYFVVHDRAAASDPANLALNLRVVGGEARVVGNEVEFIDSAGRVVGTMPDAFAWDAKNDAKRLRPVLTPWRLDATVLPEFANTLPDVMPVTMSVDVADGASRLQLSVDPEWLEDDATVYPVVVDPVVQASAGLPAASYPGYEYKGYFDTRFDSAWPNTKYYSDDELLIGTPNSGSAKHRSFVNVTRANAKGKLIKSATLKLFAHHSWSCTAKSWNVRATAAVSTSTTWSSMPAGFGSTASSTVTKGYSSSCADAAVSVNIKTLWQELAAKSGSTDSYALRIMAGSETDNFSWKRFYSADYATASKRPVVSFTYNQAPSVPTTVKVDGTSYATNGTGSPSAPLGVLPDPHKVKFTAYVQDPDKDTVAAQFKVESRDPEGEWAVLGTPTSATVPDKGTVSYTMTGTLVAGKQYRVTARAKDAMGVYSAYTTTPFYFEVLENPPDPPTEVLIDGQPMPVGQVTLNDIDHVYSAVVTDPDSAYVRLALAIFEDGAQLGTTDQALGTLVASGERSTIAAVPPGLRMTPGHTYTFKLYSYANGKVSPTGFDLPFTYIVEKVWPGDIPATCDSDVAAASSAQPCPGGS